MTPDQFRLEQLGQRQRLTLLAQELTGLGGLSRFMMSGAHPDDECAPMLAALHYRDGMQLSYACSTRGEGGQNDIGTERGGDLGALRTAEMEAACNLLNMRMYWLSQTPDDTITDWRLSKSGTETLDVWGHKRTLARMVHILRRDRPDILCPTFLDVPGQHGHHRAMTQTAHEAFEAAADPRFADCELPVWQVSKLYLPAWSGAGRAYDDDLPPPPATVAVNGQGRDLVTGWTYAQIGALAHGHHRSQGMGYWPDDARDYSLHLAETRVGPDETTVMDNLPHRFADLGLAPLDALAKDIPTQILNQSACDSLLQELLKGLRAAKVAPDMQHRIDAQITQTARAIALNAQAVPVTHAPRIWLDTDARVRVTGLTDTAELALPNGWENDETGTGPTETAEVEQGYRDHYDPRCPPLPALRVTHEGAASLWPLSTPLIARPRRVVQLTPSRILINQATGASTARLSIEAQTPRTAKIDLCLPEGWRLEQQGEDLTLTLSPETEPGIHDVDVLLDGQPAQTARAISYPHIRATQAAKPARIDLSVVDVKLPDHPISYVGSGLDTVAGRLRDIGLTIHDMSDAHLVGDVLEGAKTLLVGIHAFRFNTALADLRPKIHDWVRNGGTLVTLYHRPWDNWDPQTTPPEPMEIGQPSLRWRVTNKDAAVHVLEPQHPLLKGPNLIAPEDFNGWVKERGLYFAKSWSPAYTPLLAMSDPDEAPLKGALLSADIGAGRHTHIALNLHHQLEHGVQGAIRLLVNALERRS